MLVLPLSLILIPMFESQTGTSDAEKQWPIDTLGNENPPPEMSTTQLNQ